MNTTVLSIFSHLFCALLLLQASSCQRSLSLRFDHENSLKTNILTLEIPERQYRELQGRPRTKFALDNPVLSFNGQTRQAEDIHLRGSSSLLFRRKSFSVSLEDPLPLSPGIKLKKFNLVSLCMDRSYYENVFAFHCLEHLGISNLYHEYTELWINSHPEGVYLIQQRPNDYAIADQQSPYVLRRGANDQIDGDKLSKETSEEEAAKYKGAYQQIVLMAKDHKEEALYSAWQKLFDIDAYFRLLAFNYWVRNGDYADELYFYITEEGPSPRFRIIPWDFDDIFAAQPHEGIEEKNRLIGDRMLFSGEAELDRIIAIDPFLYQKYLQSLQDVMNEISDETLGGILEDVYRELYPYYQKPEIIEMSKYDQSRQTSLERLKEDLNRSYQQMAERRSETLQKLKKKL